MRSYEYETQPYEHQRTAFEESWDAEFYALLMEMGTGKSKVAIDTMAAATFRSAEFTIQVTNSTDSTYHLTKVLLIHDGTTPGITEYGTVFTGSAAEATFDADISSGNVRLLATPASTDSMTFKVVRHCITV